MSERRVAAAFILLSVPLVFKRIIAAVVAGLILWIGWEVVTFPDVTALAKNPPENTAFMKRRARELKAAGKDDTIIYQWVPYGRISPNLRRAVLVAEDNEFYEHEGVDTKAMREAFERNWKRRKITQGGSTITQQLAKNLYLSPSRNPVRKIKEYFIARSLENHLSKKRILELYLNTVELGERVYGAEAASRAYFGRSAAALAPEQAALLAGSLPNPRVMNPASPNKRLRARQRMILSRMRRWGYVFEREVLTEKKAEPQTAPSPAPAPPTDTDLTPEPTDTGTDTEPEQTDTTATESSPTETTATDTREPRP
jgi:monofunctional biosynthetic peptidoglycan transglycosylase